MTSTEERRGASSEQNIEAEGEVGLLETRTGGSDNKGGTPDQYLREEEFLEKNKGVSLLEQHKELQEIVEKRKEGVVEKQRKEEERSWPAWRRPPPCWECLRQTMERTTLKRRTGRDRISVF